MKDLDIGQNVESHDLPDIFRKARHALKLTQRDVAVILDVTQVNVSAFERGIPPRGGVEQYRELIGKWWDKHPDAFRPLIDIASEHVSGYGSDASPYPIIAKMLRNLADVIEDPLFDDDYKVEALFNRVAELQAAQKSIEATLRKSKDG